MRTATKMAIIGGAGLLAAYFSVIHPPQKKNNSNGLKANGNYLIKKYEKNTNY